MSLQSVWPSALERLEKELSKQQFTTWIAPLNAVSENPEHLRLVAPNRFVMQWVRDQFKGRIETLAAELSGGPVTVVIDLAATVDAHDAQIFVPEETPQGATSDDTVIDDIPGPAASERIGAIRHVSNSARGNLAAGYTFDNFVPGKANQLARAAAVQVAEHPGSSYNPLYIHGGVGLGKTHLIQAVGNFVLAHNPTARIRYLHSGQYVSDVVRAYRDKSFDEFKRNYHSLDLLLVDDIQFFSGKDRTQEEFFYVFNALLEGQKQIIVTSDSYPKDMPGIDERLRSRFAWGLTVGIQPPEQEMRVAIVLRKAQEQRMNIPEDVAFLIAQSLRANVRELEGAILTLRAFARFSNQPITIETAREALKDVISKGNRQVSVESIQKAVADYYKIKIADMHSKKRSRNIARPRQIAMTLAKDLTAMSYPDIGEAFGNRDHTTVIHACRTIAALRESDPNLNREYVVLEETLKA